MAAYDLNPKPESRCNCGPRLLCTHNLLVPHDPREITQDPARNHLAATDADPGDGHNK